MYEDIGHTVSKEVKAVYYTHEEEKYINVFVMDPNSQVIYKRTGENHGIVTFETTVAGRYTFIFSNLDDWTDRTVTFALHTFEEKEEEV